MAKPGDAASQKCVDATRDGDEDYPYGDYHVRCCNAAGEGADDIGVRASFPPALGEEKKKKNIHTCILREFSRCTPVFNAMREQARA